MPGEWFKGQRATELKSLHRQQGTVFSDPVFPGVDSVLGTSDLLPADIVWKRPHELVEKPRLVVNGEGSTGVKSGPLSCNWFVSACSLLAALPELRNKVVPDYWEQEGSDKYCGLYYFTVWRFGKWVGVVVDDLLPTRGGTLLVTHSADPSEFWPALLEKAYAKLHGGYEALREGELVDALVDFTGGLSEAVDLQAGQYSASEDRRRELYDLMTKETADNSLMAFTMASSAESDLGTRTELGLVRGHAYLVTEVRKVYLQESSLKSLFKGREKAPMVRLKSLRQEDELPDSPKSGSGEMYAFSTGALSRLKSRLSEWQRVKESERHRLGLITKDSSEFWMPMEDVVGEFTECLVVRLVGEGLFSGRKTLTQQGVWRPSVGTSSPPSSPQHQAFHCNSPQYLLDVSKDCEVMVQLLQYQHAASSSQARANHLIALYIINVEENRRTRVTRSWSHHARLVEEGPRRRREVTWRGRLPQGRHVVMPSAHRHQDHAAFLLRILSHRPLTLREASSEAVTRRWWLKCFTSEVEWVTAVIVKNAEYLGLQQHDPWKQTSCRPYCVLSCEGTKVSTPVARNDAEPIWNKSYIFYRRHTSQCIRVQVYSKNSVLRDTLVGESELAAGVTHGAVDVSLTLRPKQGAAETGSPPGSPPASAGVLHLTFITEDNPQAL